MDKKCAFDNGESCRVLQVKDCFWCRFKKTEQELKEGRERATDRLMTLDREFLNYVKAKYYNDRRHRDDGE